MGIVCVDAGTSVIKAVGYTDDGTEQVVVRRSTTVSRPRPGWAEQDMGQVHETVLQVVREVTAALHGDVRLVAVTAQGDGCWLVDRDGHPTGPAVLWNDSRADAHTSRWQRDGVLDRAFSANGSMPSSGLVHAVLAWLEVNDPDRLARSASALTCGSWIFRCLTGEVGLDESDAAVPFLDLQTREYSEDLLDLYGLAWARRLLPPVRHDDDRVAVVRPDVAARLGLAAGTPVVLAPYDIAATALGAGAVHAGQACVILGTTLCTEVVQDRPVLDGPPTGLTIPSGAGGRVLRAFPTLAGVDVLHWACRLLGVPGPDALAQLALASPAGARGVTCLPFLSPGGERAPFFEPAARGSLDGLTFDAGPEDLARAVFEGLSLVVADCLRAAGTSAGELRVCGGGAANDMWVQLLADVTALPVTRSQDAEVGARGAMLVAATAVGDTATVDHAVAAHVRPGHRAWPDPATTDLYSGAHATYVRQREAAVPVWRAAAGATPSTVGASA